MRSRLAFFATVLLIFVLTTMAAGAQPVSFSPLLTIDSAPRGSIDLPTASSTATQPFAVEGWALDASSSSGTGVDQVKVYDGTMESGTLLGTATYGLIRTDVGAAYGGSQFNPSGYRLPVSGLSEGAHSLHVYYHLLADDTWAFLGPVNVTAQGATPDPHGSIDMPGSESAVAASFAIEGWALDAAATAGTGVDLVRVYEGTMASGALLGQATYGLTRTDVGTAYGDARFNASGYRMNVSGLGGGTHTIYVYYHLVANDTWAGLGPVNVALHIPKGSLDTLACLQMPCNTSQPIQVAGWALDAGAASGTGVDEVKVYEGTMVSGAFLGSATYGLPRPDVGNAYGAPQFTNTGYSLKVTTLSAGVHTINVYAHYIATGDWLLIGTRPVETKGPFDGYGGIDTPLPGSAVTREVRIEGWAINARAASGAGISTIYVSMVEGHGEEFLGLATYGLPRPDVAAVYGEKFLNSGFSITVSPTYWLKYLRVSVSAPDGSMVFSSGPITRLATSPRGTVDTPAGGSNFTTPFAVEGWALDTDATSGTGIDTVRVYDGTMATGTLLGTATYGLLRLDVGAVYGAPQYNNTGFRLEVSGLSPGAHTLNVYARTTGDSWMLIGTRTVTVT